MSRASQSKLGLLALTVLSACAATEPSNLAGDAQSVASRDLSAQDAVSMFRSACLDTQPSLAGAEAALTQLGFAAPVEANGVRLRQHEDYRVSFSVSQLCTMIYWGSETSLIDAHISSFATRMSNGVFAFQGNQNRQIRTVTVLSPGKPNSVTVTINSTQ